MKLRFSISTLFLLTALVGVSLGWYLDHKRQSHNYESLSAKHQYNTRYLNELMLRDRQLEADKVHRIKELISYYGEPNITQNPNLGITQLPGRMEAILNQIAYLQRLSEYQLEEMKHITVQY